MGKFKKPSFSLVLAVVICLSLTAGIVSAASQIETHRNVNLTVANDEGVRYQEPNIPNGTYNFFNPTQTGGLNELHISSDSSDAMGDVTNDTATSGSSIGTFYLTNTGGRGWHDNGILMIAVNGTAEDLSDFSVQINSAGYQWTPVQTGTFPNYSSTNYVQGISETFTISDFTGNNGYNSTWKPCYIANYPLYEGQNVTQDISNNNTFHIIFVDLYAGIIGSNTLSSQTWLGQTVVNNGALQVNYTISNLPEDSLVAFNTYGYCQSSSQGNGIRWTNSVNNIGNNSLSTSGWNVASWFQ